jgi:hypothetical protein
MSDYMKLIQYRPRKTSTGETTYDTVEVTTHSQKLEDVVSAFEDFLKASGFAFDGHLEIVNKADEAKL